MGGGDDDGPVNPFVLPEDDGDTFKAIGLSLGKSIAVLFCLTAAAASTFQAAEVDREMNAARKARVTADRLKRFYNISDGDFSDLGDALSMGAPKCGRCSPGDLDSKCESKQKHCNWNWAGSFYFAFTIFTTIGYGTFTPSTSLGKGLVVLVFFPGVVALGYFMSAVARLNRKAHHDLGNLGDTMAFQGCMCMFVFALPFLFVLAYGAHAAEMEGWTLGNGCYYAFVTLSTIGFGDYSIRDMSLPEVFFILLGVGVISMAIGVIQDLAEAKVDSVVERASAKLAADDKGDLADDARTLEVLPAAAPDAARLAAT